MASNSTNKKRSYTVAFKLEVISCAEQTSKNNAAKQYKINRKRVKEWIKQKSEIEAIKNNKNLNSKQIRVLSGRGRKLMYPELEYELLEFVKKMREEKNCVTTLMIQDKALELGKILGLEDFKASRSWVARFKDRNNLVQRARTQVAQKFPEDAPLIIKNFLKNSQEITKNINKEYIISFDETPIWFDMLRSSTIDFRGVREVQIKTTGNDKLRFTVVLAFTASGKKLPPAIMFKLKNNPKGNFPKDIVLITAPCANMRGDLMLSAYIPQV
jgi:transposase-like protein